VAVTALFAHPPATPLAGDKFSGAAAEVANPCQVHHTGFYTLEEYIVMVTMRGSWKLFTVFDIDIELHISFLLLLPLVLFFDWTFMLILFVLFTSIVAHELTHSLMAKREGVEVKKIVLLPIGGMAVMSETKLSAFDEFRMAIAGPLFNFAFCLVIALAVYALGIPILGLDGWNLAIENPVGISLITLFVSSYFWLNWLLGVFNLFIPAIPLDGGRVFRSMLAMGMKYVDATRVATRVSRIVTIFLFLFAFFTYNIILMVISVFIWLGSAAEMEFALSDALLAGVPLNNVLRTNYLLVDDDLTIDMVVADMITSRSLVALIEMDGHIGTTSLYDIRHVPKSKWKTTKIGRVSRKLKPIGAKHSIMDALKRMNKEQVDALPVTYKRKLKGVVFRDDILKVFEILKVVNE